MLGQLGNSRIRPKHFIRKITLILLCGVKVPNDSYYSDPINILYVGGKWQGLNSYLMLILRNLLSYRLKICGDSCTFKFALF